jgi:hypothetical protein
MGGGALVAAGDDRLEPAATVHIGWSPFEATDVYYWGRLYGPVKQENGMITLVRKWGLFKSNVMTAHFGIALLDERTTIHYDDPLYASYNQQQNALNGGVDFGVVFAIPPHAGPVAFAMGWDSHVFPAGAEGMLLLATGRKETFSVTMGIQL